MADESASKKARLGGESGEHLPENPITITKEPQDKVVVDEGSHELTVEVSSDADAVLKYEWFFRPREKAVLLLQPSSSNQVYGPTSSSKLAISPVTEAAAGFYFCRITHSLSGLYAVTALAEITHSQLPLAPVRQTTPLASLASVTTCLPVVDNNMNLLSDMCRAAGAVELAEVICRTINANPDARMICESFHELKPDLESSANLDFECLARRFCKILGRRRTDNVICSDLLPVFNVLFKDLGCDNITSSPIMRSGKDGRRANKIDIATIKYFDDSAFFLWVLAEIKTEQSKVDALPQLIRYYEIYRDEHIPMIFEDKNPDTGYFPSYGLKIIQGDTVVLYGFATLGKGKEKKTCYSTIKEANIMDSSAVCELLNELRRRVENLKKLCEPYICQVSIAEHLSPFPAATLPCLIPFCMRDAIYTNALSVRAFECTGRMMDRPDSTTLVVKFPSSSYPSGSSGSYVTSTAAHNLMAGEKLAPAILHEETTEGMKIVVMEKIEGTTLSAFIENPLDKDLANPNHVIKLIISKLQSCLNELHSKGYAHGDLRGPNILIVTGEDPVVKIIDFDWSCLAEKLPGTYPELNNGLLWPAKAGEFIQLIHDCYHFAQLKAKLLKKKV